MALVPAPKPAVSEPVPFTQRENYGKVPEYLEARKAHWAVEESAARKEREIREACPPGHRMMPEEERAETLALVTQSLEAAKKEVSGEWGSAGHCLPLRHCQCTHPSISPTYTLATHTHTHTQLTAMPLRVEIPSALRRKAELEGKVSKLEDAVKVFSRPRVFVKLG
jgi:hypothetical protein